VKNTIAQCNLCYSCLPYGSTKETCQKALDQLMPNECEGCDENQQMLYKMWYSCSSLKAIHDGITQLGESYAEGGSGHESLDAMCNYCMDCSDYETELQNTCANWYYISDGWDCQPPEVPDILVLEGTVVGVEHDTTDGSTSSGTATPEPTALPTPSPTPRPTPAPTDAPTPNPTEPASDDSSTGGRPSIGGGSIKRPTPSPTSRNAGGRPGSTSPIGGNGGNGGSQQRGGGTRGRRGRL